MAKGFVRGAITYAKNVGRHAIRLVGRRESARDALGGMTRDARKLWRASKGKTGHGERRHASRMVEEGRLAYNNKDYEKAEEQFRNATLADKGYALAYLYLGNTLYKQGRTKEAGTYWRVAIQADPSSDAASKALRKLQNLDRKKEDINRWVRDHGEPL